MAVHGDGSVDTPTELGWERWKKLLKRVKERTGEERVSLLAAGVAFFGLLSIFPALIALVAVYGIVAQPEKVTEQLASLLEALSPEARDIIVEQLADIAAGSTGLLGVGSLVAVVGALWTASRGVANLLKAINAAYGVDETRSPVKLRAIALISTAVTLLLAVVAMFAIAILPPLLGDVAPDTTVGVLVAGGRWVLLVAMVATALALLYRHGPNRRPVPWSWALWGAGGATAIWVIGSALFSLYVSRFGQFASTYGALAGMIIFMLWLYLSAFVVLLGAVVDSQLEQEGGRRELREQHEKQDAERRGAEQHDRRDRLDPRAA